MEMERNGETEPLRSAGHWDTFLWVAWFVLSKVPCYDE